MSSKLTYWAKQYSTGTCSAWMLWYHRLIIWPWCIYSLSLCHHIIIFSLYTTLDLVLNTKSIIGVTHLSWRLHNNCTHWQGNYVHCKIIGFAWTKVRRLTQYDKQRINNHKIIIISLFHYFISFLIWICYN